MRSFLSTNSCSSIGGGAAASSATDRGTPAWRRIPDAYLSVYGRRCIICYFGHHYQSYALSEDLNQWLLFDDTTIKLIGEWRDVTASIRASRLQPSVLFYERAAR